MLSVPSLPSAGQYLTAHVRSSVIGAVSVTAASTYSFIRAEDPGVVTLTIAEMVDNADATTGAAAAPAAPAADAAASTTAGSASDEANDMDDGLSWDTTSATTHPMSSATTAGARRRQAVEGRGDAAISTIEGRSESHPSATAP